MRHTISLPILIITLIMVSGCTLPGLSMTNYGVVLEDLVAEPNELQSGEPFVIRTRIRNSGEIRAENMLVKIFNTGTEMYSDIRCSPSYEMISNCEVPFDLVGEDRERGVQGESKTCAWNCMAPILEKGVNIPYNPSIRMYYSYTASTIKPVLITSQDELIRLQSEGKPPPSQPGSTTEGPVSLDIKVKGPLKVWQGKQQLEFPIEIDVQNTGEGTVCSLGIAGIQIQGCDNPENWNRIVLFSKSPDIIFSDCDLEYGQTILNLWKGRGKIVCNAEMMFPMAMVNVQKNIEISAVYDYFIDKSVSVTVRGTSDIELI